MQKGLKPSIHLQCKFKGTTSHVLVLINWSQGTLHLTAYLSLSLQVCGYPFFFLVQELCYTAGILRVLPLPSSSHCRGGPRLSLQWSCNHNSFLRHKHVFMTHTHLQPQAPSRHCTFSLPQTQPHRACRDAPAFTPPLGNAATAVCRWHGSLYLLTTYTGRGGRWSSSLGVCQSRNLALWAVSERQNRQKCAWAPCSLHTAAQTTLSCVIQREDTACYYSLLLNKAHDEESIYILLR